MISNFNLLYDCDLIRSCPVYELYPVVSSVLDCAMCVYCFDVGCVSNIHSILLATTN